MLRSARIGWLVLIAGCAGRRPAPPLAGPSSAPVMETPARVAIIAAPGDADWKALGDEATGLLSQYIRINTTNPPGNEIAAARWLADMLRRDGIESRIFEPAPGKANLYARLAGDGSARPVILLRYLPNSFMHHVSRITPHLSTSPSTISSVPISATTSATRWPMDIRLSDCRLMYDGGRIRIR